MRAKVRDFTASIEHIDHGPVARVLLRVAPDYSFHAGQYLLVHGPGQVDIPLSIASAPSRLPHLSLHFKPTPGLAESAAMQQALSGTELSISSAMGDVRCSPPDTPQWIIAGGTGAAQAFSCAIHRAEQPAASDTTILWCVDHQQELYELQTMQQLPRTELITVVDDRHDADNRALQWIADHAQRHAEDQVIIAGSPAFVYAVTDVLTAAGLDQAALQADAYSYAPR